jgi:hypothetical protein
MSTLTASAPERADAPETRRKRQPTLYSRYLGAMLYFMGAALIAGAVVHYPLDPPVYTVICIVGALVFLLGTVVNEFILAPERPAFGRAIALVTFSLLLSFGVGMVGGGIQHFEAFPERSAAMAPIGLLMSYAAFVAKDPEGRWRHVFSLFGAGVVVVTALTWVGMSALADSMESTGSGHSHGTSDAPTDEAPAEQEQPPADHHEGPSGDQQAPAEHDHGSHDH